MNAKKRDEDLDKLLQRAIERPEVARLCAETGLPYEYIRNRVNANLEDVQASASDEESFATLAENKLFDANSQVAEFSSQPSVGTVNKLLVLALAAATLGAYSILAAKSGWKAALLWPDNIPLVLIASATFAFALISWGWGSAVRRKEREELAARLGLEKLEKNVEIAHQQWDSAIIEKGIVPELRELFNDYLQPSYADKLGDYTARGLSEVFDSSHEIDTSTKTRVYRVLDSLPGASVGVAGPRGVGKTTLLASLCGRKAPQGEKPYLSVMCSAPVEYNPRDFILNLFTVACRRVLQDQGWSEGTSSPGDRGQSLTSRPSRPSGGEPAWANTLAMVISVSITVGVLFALFYAIFGPSKGQTDAWIGNIWAAFGIKPANLIFWGTLLMVVILYLERFLRLIPRPGSSRYEREGFPLAVAEDVPGKTPLGKEAYSQLLDLRFQQSYSSGWSGSLKLPVGLEGGINSAHSLAQKQRSLPELVESFRRFLQLAATEYSKLLIAIDELDKLESDEKAHAFLNEIKAVFGLPKVFYLVSVSESAISAFERRGLPFRDAFDSTFDTILYVDYLKLKDSKRLLQRRTTRLPVPFMAFCHCSSGGLPRDIIRACREMIVCAHDNDIDDLGSLCRVVVRDDIRAKVRAVEIALGKVHLDSGIQRFSRQLDKMRSGSLSPDLLLAISGEVWKDAEDMVSHAEETLQYPGYAVLAAMQKELATYACFSATLLELFIGNRDEGRWRELEESGALDQLAGARQRLSTNTTMGRLALADFRTDQGLTPINLPLEGPPGILRT